MGKLSSESQNNIRSLVHQMIDRDIPLDVLLGELEIILDEEVKNRISVEFSGPLKLFDQDNDDIESNEMTELLKSYKWYARNLNMMIEQWCMRNHYNKVNHFNDLLSDTEASDKMINSDPVLYETIHFYALPLQEVASIINSFIIENNGKDSMIGDALFARYLFVPSSASVRGKHTKTECLREYDRLIALHGNDIKGNPESGYYRNSSVRAVSRLADELNFKLDLEEKASFKLMANISIQYDLSKPSAKTLIKYATQGSDEF